MMSKYVDCATDTSRCVWYCSFLMLLMLEITDGSSDGSSDRAMRVQEASG